MARYSTAAVPAYFVSLCDCRIETSPHRWNDSGVAGLVDDPLAHAADRLDCVLRHRRGDVAGITERCEPLRAEQGCPAQRCGSGARNAADGFDTLAKARWA